MDTITGSECLAGGAFITECDHKVAKRFQRGDIFPYCYDAESGEEPHEVKWLPTEARSWASEQARILLSKAPVIIDTETTGLGDDAEICEIAIIDHLGGVIVDSKVRPTSPIPEDATRVHGICDEDVVEMPTLADVLDREVRDKLEPWPIGIYNADYDLRLIRQSAAALGRFDILEWAVRITNYTTCLMELYAVYAGNWSDYHQSYIWQSLSAAAQQCGIDWNGLTAHSARGDALMTLAVLHHMAAGKTTR